jgi:hypothetical protein
MGWKEGLPIPMSFGVFVERRKHDRKNDFDIVTHEVTEILVVPEIQSSLSDLQHALVLIDPSPDPILFRSPESVGWQQILLID